MTNAAKEPGPQETGVRFLTMVDAAERVGKGASTLRVNPTFPVDYPDIVYGNGKGAYHPLTIDAWRDTMEGRGARKDLWEPLHGQDDVPEDYVRDVTLANVGAEHATGTGTARHITYRAASRCLAPVPLPVDGMYHGAVVASIKRKLARPIWTYTERAVEDRVPLIVAPWRGGFVVRVLGFDGVTQAADFDSIPAAARAYAEGILGNTVSADVRYPITYDVEGAPGILKFRNRKRWLDAELAAMDSDPELIEIRRTLRGQGVTNEDIDRILNEV